MARSSDLAQLSRLEALCDARHRLAVQGQAHAAQEVRAATHRRMDSEAAVTEAERAWQQAVASGVLGPELATVAGEVLIARAATLTLAIDRETQSERTLEIREEARIEARARSQQIEEVITLCRRKVRRQREERLLAAIEDRTAYRWRWT